MVDIEALKRQMTTRTKNTALKRDDFLSSGSTLLDLGCSGYPTGAFAKGSYILFIGDSDTGKTWVSMTCLAEAAKRKDFNKHRFVYDGPEHGAKMDIEKFFGKAVKKRLEIIEPSDTVEDFYYSVDDDLDSSEPFIRILDSIDAIDSDEDQEKFESDKKAARKGKTDGQSGSYGTGKAKVNSRHIKRMVRKINKSKSILIVINQTRDNIGRSAMFNPKTRAGGRALEFYADIRLWSSLGKTITKTVRGKKRQQGAYVTIKIKRSRFTGKKREVLIPIYHSYGIDDIGSCIDYLTSEGHWKQKKGIILAPDLGLEGSRSSLIKAIEEQGMEKELQDTVGMIWNEIESALQLKRKSRYE